jgi:hypothetical protein
VRDANGQALSYIYYENEPASSAFIGSTIGGTKSAMRYSVGLHVDALVAGKPSKVIQLGARR